MMGIVEMHEEIKLSKPISDMEDTLIILLCMILRMWTMPDIQLSYNL